MQHRRLGPAGLEVSAIGLGCMGMSGTYGDRNDEESVRTIGHALDIGMSFIDTSDSYGFGHNEGLVGQALRGRRGDAVLATKFSLTRNADGSPGIDGRPEYVRQACDASLKRLGVETIDLYYQHRTDPNVPTEETVGAMAELVAAGKVRYLGLSEASAENIRKAQAVHPITALQSEFSLFSRDIEDNGVLATIRELGIALVPFSPIGRGLLTATVRTTSALAASDNRHSHPRFQGENLAQNLRLVDALDAVAAELGATTAQVALAWLLAQAPDIVPIPGTKRSAYVDENAGAATIVLTAAHAARIEAAVPKGAAVGSRISARSPGQMAIAKK
jgi:aryl-alcohol dehydrogenase-like predicted oxidoreductase